MAGRIAVVGGGWAGLAAAVGGTAAGQQVTLFEMAPQLGGRARRVDQAGGPTLDNGQHILLGAYSETLALMRRVGADPAALLKRLPLALVDPRGAGLRLPRGAPVPAFVRAVFAHDGWSLAERAGLLATALRWRLAGFEAKGSASVADITASLSSRVRETLIEPLCVAALNTPADRASAQVFLRVLRDALFSGPGAADMLLPRVPLSSLMPDPATQWLTSRGATIRLGARVDSLAAHGAGWCLDGEYFDGTVMACSASEAARLVSGVAPDWARRAAAFDYEPIITVYVQSRGTRLAQAMTALATGGDAPAQFVFDLGAIDDGGARDGQFAFVVSGARLWIERGLDATVAATLRQAVDAFDESTWREPPRLLRVLAEKRATFLCTPLLDRPTASIADGLVAAGDYIDGPYPATLEGAVRSGAAAISMLRGR